MKVSTPATVLFFVTILLSRDVVNSQVLLPLLASKIGNGPSALNTSSSSVEQAKGDGSNDKSSDGKFIPLNAPTNKPLEKAWNDFANSQPITQAEFEAALLEDGARVSTALGLASGILLLLTGIFLTASSAVSLSGAVQAAAAQLPQNLSPQQKVEYLQKAVKDHVKKIVDDAKGKLVGAAGLLGVNVRNVAAQVKQDQAPALAARQVFNSQVLTQLKYLFQDKLAGIQSRPILALLTNFK